MRVLALVALLAASCTWTWRDGALHAASQAALAVDWAETRTTVGPKCQEANPILGHCPPALRIDLYFVAVTVLHAVASIVLPPPWRNVWQAALLGAEAACDLNNWQNGNGIRP